MLDEKAFCDIISKIYFLESRASVKGCFLLSRATGFEIPIMCMNGFCYEEYDFVLH